MVTLDPNLTFNTGVYYYLIKNGNVNAYASIDQYAKACAEQQVNAQNTQQANSTQSADKTGQVNNNATTDYATLIENLRLDLPANKLAILRLIPYSELIQFLSLLDKDQLVNGLQLFTKDKLLKFISSIPKEDLLKMLSKLFLSGDKLLEMLPIKELNNFLSSKKIQKNDLIKIFQSMSTTELAQILEATTGIPQGKKSQAELLQALNGLDTPKILDGIKGLEYKKMRVVVSDILKLDPTLYTEFTQGSLFNSTLDFAKTSLVEGMGVLDNDQLIKFLGELPENFIALVATQIDTNLFAQILLNNYQNLLSSLAAA